MATTTLYQLSADLAAALAKLDADGEIPDSLEAELDALGEAFADKIDGVLRARVNFVAQAEGIRVELERLQSLHDALTRRAEWLKDYVFRAMLATGQAKLQTPLFKLWIQRNGRPSISLANGVPIPTGFVKTSESFNAEKAYQVWLRRLDLAREFEELQHQAAQAEQSDDAAKLNAAHARLDVIMAEHAGLALPEGIIVREGSHLRIK